MTYDTAHIVLTADCGNDGTRTELRDVRVSASDTRLLSLLIYLTGRLTRFHNQNWDWMLLSLGDLTIIGVDLIQFYPNG